MSYASSDPRATDRLEPTTSERSSALDLRLVRFLERMAASKFFGKVVVSFQNGKATDVRIEQTKKLEEL